MVQLAKIRIDPISYLLKYNKTKQSLFGLPYSWEDEYLRYLQWDKTLNVNKYGQVAKALDFTNSNIDIKFEFDFTEK
jgi:hypothetical protein